MENIKKIGDKDSNLLGPAIRVFIVMLVVTGIVYPIVLVAIGQGILPFQSNGSLISITENGEGEGGGKGVGSLLIAQEFKSPKFFHPRASSDSASGVDPHITPENAFAQILNVSEATEIPKNVLRTIIELNIERNRVENLLAFAPNYVNVLEVNLELIRQYPDLYSEFLTPNENEILLRGEES
ncbi:MAG: potassium-transporting ATPase subunit C [Nitrososphaeraceae archaeon]